VERVKSCWTVPWKETVNRKGEILFRKSISYVLGVETGKSFSNNSEIPEMTLTLVIAKIVQYCIKQTNKGPFAVDVGE
jgi:hypothetical protein